MPKKHSPPRQRPPIRVLTAGDVARIWTEEARRTDPDAPEIKVTTIYSYIKESRPMVGGKPGRYADRPVPAPTLPGRSYLWTADQEPDLRAWWNDRLGQAHGMTAPGKPKPGTP